MLSIRIPKELKEKMRVIIKSIEEKIRQLETEKVLKEIEEMNNELRASKIPAWEMIREDRDAGR